MNRIVLQLLIFFLLCTSAYAQEGTVNIEAMHFNIDTDNGLLLINQDHEDLNELYPELKTSIQVEGKIFTFVDPVLDIEVGTSYPVIDSNSAEYELFFTQLPIIRIQASDTIVDEPRILAAFEMSENDGAFTQQNIGIEIRGGSSQNFPKQSYRIEFWEDQNGEDNINISLLGMRDDDDWNLQAMYNEPLRIRSKINFDFWKSIDTLYYAETEDKAINGVQQEYVELFVDDSYKGVYALSERVDRKQLQLQEFEEPTIRGELYKGISWDGAPTFTEIAPYDNSSEFWKGFKYEYPGDLIDWSNLYRLVDFALFEDSISFYQDYQEQINIDNAVNYFIFLNLLKAQDNTGKNLYVARYDIGEPYFFVPWDLDGTYGVLWNGSITSNTERILSNGFYDKLLCDSRANGFLERLKSRWTELRMEVITAENIRSAFETQFQYLDTNGVYQRELIAWEEDEFLDTNNMAFTDTWIIERIAYLDKAFDEVELLGAELVDKFTEDGENEVFAFEVSPIPASNTLLVKILTNEEVNSDITIYNALGQIVKTQTNQENIVSIDISDLSNGIYFLEAQHIGQPRDVVKFSVQR